LKFFDAFATANEGDTLICGAAHIDKRWSAVETMTALHTRGLFSTVDRDDWDVIPREMIVTEKDVAGCRLQVEGGEVKVA
jgi:hypothetical protein